MYIAGLISWMMRISWHRDDVRDMWCPSTQNCTVAEDWLGADIQKIVQANA